MIEAGESHPDHVKVTFNVPVHLLSGLALMDDEGDAERALEKCLVLSFTMCKHCLHEDAEGKHFKVIDRAGAEKRIDIGD